MIVEYVLFVNGQERLDVKIRKKMIQIPDD